MPSLQKVEYNFFSYFQRVDGYTFQGTLFNAEEGSFAPYDFSLERLVLHVSPETPIMEKDEFFDQFGRRLLVARHGVATERDTRLFRSYRVFELTHQVSWTRMSTVNDPVTNQPRSDVAQDLGDIWIMKEPNGGRNDPGMNIHDDKFRVVTGHEVQIGDRLSGQSVRRVDEVIGINHIELQ